MTIDPSIPLKFNPTQNMGPDWAGAMQGARTAWQVDAYRREAQGLDATKKVFSDPSSLDKDGNPTPEAMRQVMSVSPEAGMKLRENVLLSQQRQLQTNLLKSKTFEQQYEMTNGVAEEALVAYQTAMDGGIPKEAALKRGQEVWTQGLDRLRSSGQFSEAQQQSWKPQFDPATAQSHAWSYGDYMKWKHQEHQETEQRDRDRRLENKGWVVQEDPSHPDEKGNPTPYRYNADLAQYTDIDGKPLSWKPGGARKVGTEPKVTPADKSEDAAMRIKKGLVEQFTQDNGRSPNDFEDAQLEQQARNYKSADLAKTKSDQTAISDAAARLLAEQTMAGDYSGVSGIARNAASVKKLNEARAALAREKNISGADLAANHAQYMGTLAASRLLGTRSAGIGLGISEMEQFGPMVLEASEKIDRTRFPSVNALQLAAERGVGGEEVIRLVDALNAEKNAYQQVLARGGLPTDDARRRSDEVIDKAWAKGQIRAAIDQLHKEAVGAQSASVDVRAQLFSEITGRPKSEYPGWKNAPQTTPQSGKQATPSDADRAYLKANPGKKALFIKRFGQSEADKILGQ